MGRVLLCELLALSLAAWDRTTGSRDHVLWRRIGSAATNERASSEPHAASPPRGERLVEERVGSLLRVAESFETGVPLDTLTELLPEDAPSSPSELGDWLGLRPELARVDDGRAFAPGAVESRTGERLSLGREYQRAASELFSGPLAFTLRWVRSVGISGSVAYGEPTPGDDLDLFVVTRSGSTWWFLLATYAALRLTRWVRPTRHFPDPCFNYVLDDRVAPGEFEPKRGFLFAREALAVRVLAGDDYYRGMLARATWMREEIPRLYDTRTRDAGANEPQPAPFFVRVLNGLSFVPLAAYLQCMGILRNWRARRVPSVHGSFRTVTGRRRMAFASRRFEEIGDRYERESVPAPVTGGFAPNSRMQVSR